MLFIAWFQLIKASTRQIAANFIKQHTMNTKDIIIKETETTDFNDIMEVEKQAFGYDKEAELVAGLLKDQTATPYLSLLAFYKNEAIGHILFTKVTLEGAVQQPMLHILAPLAVKPKFQKMGVGGMLIKTGIEFLRERGTEIVFVLGHMDYYPRFGFIPDAKSMGFVAPYPIPEKYANAWMVLPLTGKALEMKKNKNQMCR